MVKPSSLTSLLKHSINLKDDIQASSQPHRLTFNLQQPIKDEIDKLIQNYFIDKSQSMHTSSIMPIIQRNGKTKIAVE